MKASNKIEYLNKTPDDPFIGETVCRVLDSFF